MFKIKAKILLNFTSNQTIKLEAQKSYYLLIMIGNRSISFSGEFRTRWLSEDDLHSIDVIFSHECDLDSDVPGPFAWSVGEVEFFGTDVEQIAEVVMRLKVFAGREFKNFFGWATFHV